MANIFGLKEMSYESLFSKLSQGGHEQIFGRDQDIEKFNAGLKSIKDNFAKLGTPKGRGDVRENPHFLSRNYLEGKGLDCSKLTPFYRWWFAAFDLYTRSNPNDPNGPRRIIAVMENLSTQDARGKQHFSSQNGGNVRHILYTNNHYGESNKRQDAFYYVLAPKPKPKTG